MLMSASHRGWDILKNGGSAMDAVEATIRLVEDNPDDHTVGYNSYPNILGDLQLDASIMDGATLETGAIAAMQGFREAISIARRVKDTLPHVLLAGEGAERFAAEMGFEKQADMLTDDIRAAREELLNSDMTPDVFADLSSSTELHQWVTLATDPEKTRGTVNVLAQDFEGNLCTGVSTSGWAWKYPGRVGDSPIIGAGNYADNRYGAAGCTGMGEMAIRGVTAHSVVFYLKSGASVAQAGIRAMQDLDQLGGRYLLRHEHRCAGQKWYPRWLQQYQRPHLHLPDRRDEHSRGNDAHLRRHYPTLGLVPGLFR